MSSQLPKKIREVSEQSGGSMLNGMIRFVDPAELKPILETGYGHKNEAIPFAITAFGDILTWESSKYIYKVSFRHHQAEVLAADAGYFFEDLRDDPHYAEQHFETALFTEAREKLGVLADSECYGFVPLEILGGPADIAHMKKVQYKEYLQLLAQFWATPLQS